MKSKTFWIVLCLTCFGCDSRDNSTAIVALTDRSSELESLPRVAYPEFVNWSKFPVESSVNRRKVVSNTSGEVVVTTKVWLQSKAEDNVSVGSQITVKRPELPIVENEPNFAKFPATFRLPKGLTEEQFYLPSAQAKETGKDVVKVGEKEFEATVYQWTESSEAGPTSVKLWRSNEVPGRFLRQEMITKGIETTSIEEVIEISLGSDPS